jgi:hypothetical protein
MSDRLTTAATFNDLAQAQNARAALNAAGIASELRDENTGSLHWGLMPALGGLRLQVKSAELAAGERSRRRIPTRAFRRTLKRRTIANQQGAASDWLD